MDEVIEQNSDSTIRQRMEAKLASLRQEVAATEQALAEMPASLLDKAIGEFHKMIGWL